MSKAIRNGVTQSRKPEATVTAPHQVQERSWGAAHSTGNEGGRGDQRKPCRHLAVTAPGPAKAHSGLSPLPLF